MFLAYMMYFVLDEEVNIIRDEQHNSTYAVLEVINTDAV